MKLQIKNYLEGLISNFESINPQRKVLLESISNYISSKINQNKDINLMYVCTHNSRRSHFGQVWAKLAAEYYEVNNVYTFSGGTEATAFNKNAIKAIEKTGIKIYASTDTTNPIYKLEYSSEKEPIICFSKVYNDTANPKQEFAAIMTCSDAEENCPFIPGVELRIGTTYDDPKAFDNTPLEEQKYDERCRQIATECMYVFSKVQK